MIINKTVIATSIIAISLSLAGCSSEGTSSAPIEIEIELQDPDTSSPDRDKRCKYDAFISGTNYATGDTVLNNDEVYACKIAGWCSNSSDWAYEPGLGNQWQDAWTLTTSCTNFSDTGPTDNIIVRYFVEWGIYGRDYHVADIPTEKLTHVSYGFIPICGPNDALQKENPQGYSALVSQYAGKPDFTLVVHDNFAALEKGYPGDKWDDPIRGSFGQLIRMKQQNPHIKVLPSIGGWTLSDSFFHFLNDSAKRAVFVNSVKEFLTTYDFFDGIDIEWEYPGGGGSNPDIGSASDYQGYADLMKGLRTVPDELENSSGKIYELTSALGAFSIDLGHQTALHDYSYSIHEGFFATSVVDNLIKAGVPSQKIVLGVAMYGRGWSKIAGGSQDLPLSGVGTTST